MTTLQVSINPMQVDGFLPLGRTALIKLLFDSYCEVAKR